MFDQNSTRLIFEEIFTLKVTKSENRLLFRSIDNLTIRNSLKIVTQHSNSE